MRFEEILNERYHLSKECINAILSYAHTFSFTKKERIISSGQRDNYVYFVETGLVRSFFEKEEKEITLAFTLEGGLVNSTPGLTVESEWKTNVEALENSSLIRISRKNMEEMFSSYIEIANWGRKIVEEKLQEHDSYFINYFWAEKGSQYLAFTKDYPKLSQRVSLKDLATYLNLTPQSLSRIRAKIR